jgi:hypothetical protein
MSEQDFITAGEFTRWRTEEADFRREVRDNLKEIIGLVRTQNGRLGKAEVTISVISRDVAALVSEENSIQTTVESIQKEGCHQYENHREAIELIEGSGAVRNMDGTPRALLPRISDLSTKQKVGAGVGIGALLIPAVSDLLKFGQSVVTWLTALHQ